MRRFCEVFIRPHVSISTAQRFNIEFLELFGRHPTPIALSHPHLTNITKPTENYPPSPHSVWKQQIEHFENEVYANPNHVDSTVCLNTLKCLNMFLSRPTHQKSAATDTLWEHAMRVLSTSQHNGKVATQHIVHTVFILYHCRRYLECKKLADSELDQVTKGRSTDLSSSAQYQASLQLLSLYVLAGMQLGHKVDAKAQAASISLLTQFTRVMRKAVSKDERRLVASSVAFLLYSYDWVYHFSPTVGQLSGKRLEESFVMRLRSVAPKWIENIFQNSHQSTGALVAEISQKPKRSSPSLFVIAGRQAGAEGDVDSLRILLRNSIKREESLPNIHVFRVSVLLADIFLKNQKREDALAKRVIDYVGTALSAETLVTVGNTSWGYKKSLHWLTEMRGPEAYFALKKVLFHKSPSEFAAVQESCGDVLTGNKDADWRWALAQTQSSLSFADSSWRKQLPTTLRLLSDAGRQKEFFDLIREYDSRDRQSNLMVAASLAQMLRHSGKWQYYTHVMDLIASSNVPQAEEGDGFLQDACLQTMYALRNAKQWEEALSMYSVMNPIMPPQAHRLLCFMVCDMPPSSPWQSALNMLSAVAPIPPACMKTLTCMYGDNSEVPRVPHERKYAMQGLIRVGRWETLLKFVKSSPDHVEGWLAYFKASEVSESVVTHETSLLRQIPLGVWRSEKLLRQAFLSCFANGCLTEFDAVLAGIPAQCPLSNEIRELIRFLIHGTPSKGALISDSYLGHCFTSFVSAFDGQIRVPIHPKVATGSQLPSTDRRGDLAVWFKIPDLCIARTQSGSDTSYYIRPFPFVSALPEQLLYATDGMVIAYKPVGASIQSVARGVLRLANASGTYRIGLLIPPSASGLFLLRKSVLGVKEMEISLQIEMELMPYSQNALPLLSAKFFARYAMVFLGQGESEGVVKLHATLSWASLVSVNDVVRNFKVDLNSEGWTFVEQDVGFGDSYCIKQLSVLDLRLGTQLRFLVPSSSLKNYSH